MNTKSDYLDPDDTLIDSGEVRRLAGGKSSMTVWRWIKAGVLPTPTQIRGRNYWSGRAVRTALATRAGRT